ncbi:hypothetical protein ACIKTA_14030, partial [Hansschlegelia beijingensis]
RLSWQERIIPVLRTSSCPATAPRCRHDLVEALSAAGAGAVTVSTLEDVFEPSPALVEDLFGALGS